jgi:putative PEP-CTERM system TPR-repeat lipoprotein
MIEGVIAKSPNLVEAWQLKGDIAALQGQDENAIAAYRKATDLRPDHLLAHVRIASLLIQQGKTREASMQIEEMKKLAPKHPQTLYLQAVLALREKNYVAAREAIQRQLQAQPDNLPGLVLDANIAFQLGAYAQAETSLLKALQQAPKERFARTILVNTYLRSRQPTKALEAIKPLLQGEGENNADVLALAGEVYMQNGNTKEAERVFAKAAALDPKDSNKRTSLALTHISTGESERGFRELEDAAATDAGIRADLALIAAHTRQRKWDAALKAIDDLEKKQPDKPLAHSLRGAVYAGKGDTPAARKSFERALQLEPTDYAAAASLARLDLAEKPDDARKRFRRGDCQGSEEHARTSLALAELRAQGGDTDEVAALINRPWLQTRPA